MIEQIAEPLTVQRPSTGLSDSQLFDVIKRALIFAKPDASEAAQRLTLQSTMDELAIESISALEMTGFIEEELGIQFADSELASIRGIPDLVYLIRKRLPN